MNTRRDILLGLGAASTFGAGPALAAGQAAAVSAHPGFKSAWKPVGKRGNLPLTKGVKTPKGEMPLSAWLDGQPTVLILWASWCGPCFGDKPLQLAMQRKLEAAKSKTRIVLVQCFDPDYDAKLTEWRLRKLGVAALKSVRATPALERDLKRWFGPSPIQDWRTSLPELALIGGDGETLGYCDGRPFISEEEEWWPQKSAFELLTSLS